MRKQFVLMIAHRTSEDQKLIDFQSIRSNHCGNEMCLDVKDDEEIISN